MATRIKIRFGETDAMGIAHHSNYFRYFEVARTDWLKERGQDYRIWESRGFNLPLIHASADYKKPTRYDDEVEIRMHGKLDGARVRFSYEVVMIDSGPTGTFPEGTLMATGVTEHVTTNTKMKIVKLPDELQELFKEENQRGS